jgi:transposase InsO family protein
MKHPVMRGSYAVAVAFLGLHCVNGDADIWLRASLVWKATAVALKMPFPIQRFQTDRGREFFAVKVKVQERLKEYGIKFRPNKPASPHLNGKVERSQKTDKAEFYATVDLCADDLKDLLAEWQHYYNWGRPHSAHNGKTPMERYFELELRKLKRCL